MNHSFCSEIFCILYFCNLCSVYFSFHSCNNFKIFVVYPLLCFIKCMKQKHCTRLSSFTTIVFTPLMFIYFCIDFFFFFLNHVDWAVRNGVECVGLHYQSHIRRPAFSHQPRSLENHHHAQCSVPASLRHILVGCKASLSQGGYTWPHNKVLKCLAAELEN